MLINWFTVSAQIINFLILVVLLKYLLYDKIIEGMKKREEEIKNRFDEAEKREKEAQEQKNADKKEKQEFENKKEELLNNAKKQADEKKKELIRNAEEEAAGIRKEWLDSIEKEQESFIDELRHLASKQVYSLTRKVLEELADSDLDEMISEKFMARLKDLNDDVKKDISTAAKKEKNIVIKSRSGLSKELRGKITRIIHDEINPDSEVSYENDRDIMPGIELSCGGQEVVWSTEKYLDELEAETNRALNKQRKKLIGDSEEKSEKENKNGDENDQGEE